MFIVPPIYTARRRRDALGMSGTIVPHVMTGRRAGAPISNPASGATGVAPQVASTRVPVSLTVYYEADPFILRRAG